MKELLEQLKEMLRTVVADDEMFELAAKATKKAHTALIKAGFTRKEATEIIAGQGIGVKGNSN